jgi:GNAT superfamily N-acetyltransferase
MDQLLLDDGSVVSFRPSTPNDREILYQIYADTRSEEMNLVQNWSEAQKSAFLKQQFEAQHEYYHSMYKGAQFLLILYKGQVVGRLYLHQRPETIRIVDIALLSAFRNQGMGRAILQRILDDAARVPLPVSIHVERYNPALQLYQRLGFEITSQEHPVYFLMEWKPPFTFPVK